MLSLALPWLLLLAPLPLLVRRYLPTQKRVTQAALHMPFLAKSDSLREEKVHQESPPAKAPYLLLWAIWLLLVVAAARPQWVDDPIPLPLEGRDIFLAVDLSASMEETDLKLDGDFVDRLTVVKSVLSDFIARRQGDRLSLILFGTHAYLQTPLTHDLKTVQTMLNESVISMAGKKTAIGEAIGVTLRLTKEMSAENKESRILILLSDGQNTAGNVQPLDAARLAKQLSLKIYTIGVGADEMYIRSLFGTRKVNPSKSLDEKTLSQIAQLTGGEYFRGRDTDALNAIYQRIDELEPVAGDQKYFSPKQDYFYYPLGLAFALSLLLGIFNKLSSLLNSNNKQSEPSDKEEKVNA